MRIRTIAANWKMHKTFDEGIQLFQEILAHLPSYSQHNVQVIFFPPFIHLEALNRLLTMHDNVYLGGQNCHTKSAGAFTGEIAAAMLRSVGARFVIIGHHERRRYFGEDNTLLAEKITTALAHGLRPIFCCGETWHTREQKMQASFVKKQLTASLFHLTQKQIEQVIVAYEPVWAIGTGIVPSPGEVQAMHQAIRDSLAERYSSATAEAIPLLYGGSCTAENASALFACSEVDGGLIGGASLQADTFIPIVNTLFNHKL